MAVIASADRRSRKAVFFDKDGTLIENIPFNFRPEKIRPNEGALDAISALKDKGYAFVVITTQAVIERDELPASVIDPVREWLENFFSATNADFLGLYFCPHENLGCPFRKPQPGLLLQAAEDHGIDLSESWMIGDILDDVEAGRRAGCRTILLDNGGETIWARSAIREPHFTVSTLREAATRVIEGAGHLERVA